jgi:hypothetical protein
VSISLIYEGFPMEMRCFLKNGFGFESFLMINTGSLIYSASVLNIFFKDFLVLGELKAHLLLIIV